MRHRACLLPALLLAATSAAAGDGLNLARLAEAWLGSRGDVDEHLAAASTPGQATRRASATDSGLRLVADFSLSNAAAPGGARGDGPLLGTQGFDATRRAMRLSPSLQIGARWSF